MSFGSFSEWAKSDDWTRRCLVSEIREVSSSPVSLCRARLKDAFGSPPTPDLHVQMVMQGHSRASIDLGQGRFDVQGRPGRFIVTPAFTGSEIEGDGAFELISLSVPWVKLSEFAESIAVELPDDFAGIHAQDHYDPYLHQLLSSVWSDASAGNLNGRLFMDTAYRSIALRLFELSNLISPSLKNPPSLNLFSLRRVIELMHDDYKRNLSLDELAEVAGVSPYHLSRQFKRMIGLPPHAYFIKIRIDRARELMKQYPQWSLSRIATACGFSDLAHFSRQFKKLMGITPSRWKSEQ